VPKVTFLRGSDHSSNLNSGRPSVESTTRNYREQSRKRVADCKDGYESRWGRRSTIPRSSGRSSRTSPPRGRVPAPPHPSPAPPCPDRLLEGAAGAVVPPPRGVIGADPARPWPVDGGGVPAYDAAQSGGRGRRARKLLMCAVASAPGRPASEYGRLCHRDGGHEGGERRRRVPMLPTLQVLHDRRVGLAERAAGDPGTANTA
jgi:hypothetical protein